MRIIQPSRRSGSGRTNGEATAQVSVNGKTAKRSSDKAHGARTGKSGSQAHNACEPFDEYAELAPLPVGKKRRRSELANQGDDQPLELSIDPAKKEFNDAFARGVRLLSMREHSVKELSNKLHEKIDKADIVLAVIDELLEKKYLSDERFTESYIRARGNRGFGPMKIRSELKAKGVTNLLIQDYLNDGAAIWFDNARTQYHKKYGDAPLSDYNTWSKRARFMQSRGFTMEQIQVTVPKVEFD